jgi:hypothetical protein
MTQQQSEEYYESISIFEKIEDYKKATEQYIQDIIQTIMKIQDGYVGPDLFPDHGLDYDEEEDNLGMIQMETDWMHDDFGINEADNNDEDMFQFLVETFDF